MLKLGYHDNYYKKFESELLITYVRAQALIGLSLESIENIKIYVLDIF